MCIRDRDLNELMDQSKSSGLRQYAQRPDVISNQYIHDLYRFFKLSQRRHESVSYTHLDVYKRQGIGVLTGGYIAEVSTFDKAYLFGACLTIISMLYFNGKVAPHYHKNKLR